MASPFVWYDLMTTDLGAACKFYGDVVGWAAEDSGMPNTYMLLNPPDAGPVAGAMEMSAEMRASGRPSWIAHIGVQDLDAKVAQVKAAGAVIHREPTPIPGVGRFSIIGDPQGPVVSLFEAAPEYQSGPAAPPNAVGQVGWRELMTTDWQAAWDFYSSNFGWTKSAAHDMGPMGTYQLFRTGGEIDAGGMFNKPPEAPGVYWLYYFTVDAIDAAAQRVKDGGGQVLMGPHEVPGGAWIVQCMDPQGAMFALTSGMKSDRLGR